MVLLENDGVLMEELMGVLKSLEAFLQKGPWDLSLSPSEFLFGIMSPPQHVFPL